MQVRWPLVLAAGAMLLMSTPVQAASLTQLQQEQQAIRQKISSTRSAYGRTTSQITGTASQIQSLNGLLLADEARVSSLNLQITATETKITREVAQLAVTHRHLVHETSLMKDQVLLMEEHGPVGYLSVVLGATSFSNFITRLLVMAQLAQMGSHLVTEIQATYHQQQVEKLALQTQKAGLATLEAQAQAAANQVASTLSYQQALEGQLQAQALSEQHSITSLNSQLSQITREIQALLAQFASGFLSRRQLFDALYPLVAPIANQYGLSPYLVLGVITEESGGNSKIVSSTGAIGLMQVEPYTASDYGISPAQLYNPEENVVAGCQILAALLGSSGFPASTWGAYSESMALVGYNAGPGTVDESIQEYKSNPSAYPTPLSWAYTNIGGVQSYATNIEALQALYQSWGAP